MSYFSSTSGGSSIISGNLTITGDLDVQGDTTLVDTTTSGSIIFDTGVVAAAANYEILRNADATNLMQFNVPTGAAYEFTINDVAMWNVGEPGTAVTSGALTSGGTNDFCLALSQTLNDSGASGGNDTYTSFLSVTVPTDITGWDNVYSFDFQYGGVSTFRYSPTTAIFDVNSLATDFTIQNLDQGSGNNTAGRGILINAGDAGSQTTGDVGGDVQLTGGDAKGSGNNDGGGIILLPGVATGSGLAGTVIIPNASEGANDELYISHDATDGVFQNADSTGGFSFVNSADAEICYVTSTGVEISSVALTSGGTDDKSLQITQTLNDSGAAGGSDVFRLIKGDITETDVTGWDDVYLFDLQIGGSSQSRLDDQGVLQIFSTDRSQNVSIFHNNTNVSIRNSTTGEIRLERSDGSHNFVSSDSNSRVTPDTIVSGGTDDFGLSVEHTLNDSGAAGGSDEYRSLKTNISPTDVTGWDSVFLFDFQYGSTSVFNYNQTTGSLGLSSLGASDFSILVAAQGSGNDSTGRSLSIQSGDGGSATTGGEGGDYNITAGDGKGSGDNGGGNIVLTGGSPSGSGQGGIVNINQPGGTPGTDSLGITHDGTDAVFANLDSTGGFSFQNSSFSELFFSDSSGFSVSQQVQTSGSPNAFVVNGAAHTTLAASTEASSVSWDLSATVQFATGAIGTQRAVNIRGPTYAFVGASTITEAATFYIDAAPQEGANCTISDTYAIWVDAGSARFDGRVLETQGADVASANNLVLGEDGNSFEITGTTEVQLISNDLWQNGARITLLFTSTPTVKHATATSGDNITILLAGAADFVASAGDTLTLILSEIGGTQAWREISRAAI